MTNINPIYSSNINYLPHFRANEENKTVTNSIERSQIQDLKGSEAIGIYNKSMINNSLEVPTIEYINLPDDINQIQGERIYGSDGELVEILVDENDKYRTTYAPDDFNKYLYVVKDKQTGEIVYKQSESSKYADYDTMIYSTEYRNGHGIATCRNKDTGKILETSKYDANGRFIEKDYERNEINVIENNSNSRTLKTYDFNGNLVDKKVKPKQKYEEKDILNPDSRYVLENNPQNLEGEKTYYSNGNLEKNIVNKNGEIIEYTFDPYGNIKEVETNNKKITYYFDGSEIIETTLPSGMKKTTVYDNSGGITVSEEYENNKFKECMYDKNGNLIDVLNGVTVEENE